MLNTENKISLQALIGNIFFFFIVLTMIFTRSLMGFKLFGFRLGELIVGFGIVLVFFLLTRPIFKKYFLSFFPYKYFYLLLASFLFSLLINGGSLISLYTYKSSSYIWMTGYVLLSYYFLSHFKFYNLHISILMFVPLVIYIFNSGNYPNLIMSFFQKYSDKFQFTKGSDVLMAFILCTFILKDKIVNKKYFVVYLNMVGALLLPLFLTLSRASFFSSCLFILAVNLSFLNVIKKNKLQYLILLFTFIGLFVLSSIRLAGLPDFMFNSSEPQVVEVIQESVSEVVERKNTNQFLGFYFCEGRLCSKDNTLDWRLDIWFDLIFDQVDKEKLIQGFGFNEIFEVMKDPNAPGRLGREGLNEHVHNHLFTIIGRMGIIGLISYLFFQINLIKTLKMNIIIYLFPLILVTSFDTTMESIQFPLLFYFLISYFYVNNEI